MASISVVLVYKGLKIAQIVEINQLSHRSNSICAYGDTFNGLTRTLMSKNLNIDVSKDLPMSTHHHSPFLKLFLYRFDWYREFDGQLTAAFRWVDWGDY